MSSRKKGLFDKILACKARKSYKIPMTIKVAIACDHGGVELKNFLKDSFKVKWIDLGTNTSESVDYPDYGYALAEAVAEGEAEFGIGICGSGIGISIACNRHSEIRAALCTNTTMAKLSREHNDANVLCLGARLTGELLAVEIVKEFLETEFEGGGRHERRVNKLSQ
jgi:ribose 5-phosphate isomerase B